MAMTLRQIQVFVAVAQTGSVSIAAKRLHLSQSAVSGALGQLESRLGVQLFDRVGKRLQITQAAENSLVDAVLLLDHADDLEQKLSSRNPVGDLRVGASLTIGNYMAVEKIAIYMDMYAPAKASLEVANTERIIERLRNFHVDVALVEGEVMAPDVDYQPFATDRLKVFCSPSNPLAKHYHVDKETLLDHRWIMREKGSGTRQALDRSLGDLANQLDIFMELEHTEAIKRAVEQDLGIACLSELTLRDAFLKGRLAPVEVRDVNWQRQLYIATHKNKHRTPALEAWIKLCTN